MPITRHQAQALLNAGEMELYDESRSNPLRKLDAAALEKRIARARRARDRARDLTQRQKLASRAATGSKRGTSGQANQRSKADQNVIFFRQEVDRIGQDIARLEAETATYKNENAGTLPELRDAKRDELVNLDTDLRQLRQDRVALPTWP